MKSSSSNVLRAALALAGLGRFIPGTVGVDFARPRMKRLKGPGYLYPFSSRSQHARYARQKAKGMLDFSGTERCLTAKGL